MVLKLEFGQSCGTRIGYTRLLIHHPGDGGVEEGGKLSDGHCSHEIVDLIQSMHMLSEDSDQFKFNKVQL
jgi:hypothetical protein